MTADYNRAGSEPPANVRRPLDNQTAAAVQALGDAVGGAVGGTVAVVGGLTRWIGSTSKGVVDALTPTGTA